MSVLTTIGFQTMGQNEKYARVENKVYAILKQDL